MTLLIGVVLVAVNALLTSACSFFPLDNVWPAFLSTPRPYPTPSSADICTSQVKPAAVNSTLFTRVQNGDTLRLINTGSYVTANITGAPSRLAYIEGGFLENRYFLVGVDIFWSQRLDQNAEATYNGRGTPFYLRYNHINEKYSTANEAYQHRDGFVVIEIDVTVVKGSYINAEFNLFANELSRIVNAGDSVVASTGCLFSWVERRRPFTNYIAYPGSHIDLESGGVQHYCSTNLYIRPENSPIVNEVQLQPLLSLLNQQRLPYENKVTPYSPGCRPFIVGDAIIPVS